VRVTDGVSTALAVSARPFMVARKAPFVGIIAPTDRQVIAGGETVTLQGLATDHEDGMLPDSTFLWTSSQDGTLGVGNRLQAALSPGEHVLTLTATDRDGQQGQASVVVQVNAPVSFRGPITGLTSRAATRW
jgi:hypothetical protein